MTVKLMLSVFLVSVTLVNLGSLQNLSESSTQTEPEAVEATDVICGACACADGLVDCSARDIQSPFTLADWEGVKTVSPTTVDLSSNPLQTLTMIAELPIQNLTLRDCSIETVQDFSFRHLADLTYLDLSYNKIATSSLSRRMFERGGLMAPGQFPSEPPVFTKMRVLSLAHNDIHALTPDLFSFVPELTSLDLSGNPLAYIDQVTMATITELVKLKELKLNSCELESLPEGLLRRQRRLERLELADNRFTTVPAVISEAVNLVYLNLNKNPIANFSETTAISSLTKLQELHLCRLSKLQAVSAGALGGLEKLVSLNLCYNPRLTTLDADFLMWTDDHDVERYPLLQKLFLNGNNLSIINSHYLDRWDQLLEVDFTNNPYECDCGVQWMVDVLVPLVRGTERNDTVDHMFCKKPQELRGLSFGQLSAQSRVLTCPEDQSLVAGVSSDMAVVLGIMIGIFATFPLVLITVLLWRRGYFARCRRRVIRREKDYDGEEEDDAF